MTYYIGDLAFCPSDELEHYGVLGQKWGVRRWQNKDGSLTAAGYDHYGYGKGNRRAGNSKPSGGTSSKKTSGKGGTKDKPKNEPKDLSETMDRETHKVDKLRVATTALSVLQLNPFAAADLVKAGVATVKTNRYLKNREKNGTLDEKTGLYLKQSEMDEKQDCKIVNPGYGDFNTGNENNCVLCSVAYDMRRRGYDVIAGQATEGYTDDQVASFYKKGKFADVYTSPSYKITRESTREEKRAAYKEARQTVRQARKDCIAKMEKENNTRGIMRLSWNYGSGAHAIAYEVKNGKLTLFDAQTGTVYKNPMQILNMADAFGYMRTDNLEPDIGRIKKYGGVR